MTSLQKTIKYIAMSFALLLTVSIIGGIVSVFTSFELFFGEDNIAGEMQTYNISGEITSLDIEISAADFTVAKGQQFSVESNHKYITVEEKNGKLVISEKKRFFGTYSGDVKLTLYIPENTVFEEAEILTGAGIVFINELSAQKLSMELGAGKVDIEKLNAYKSAEIDGGAGAITIKNSSITKLDLDMGVGELKLVSELSGVCDIDCGVGKTEIILLGTAEDYCIKVNKGLGDAIIDGKKATDGQVYGNGAVKIDVDGGVGRIEVSFEDIAE